MKLTKKQIITEANRRMNEYSRNGLFETPSFDYFYKQVCDELKRSID